jgi:hypothetical protein
VQYFDTTFSVDKTISLAHASALASAVAARQAGDLRQAAEWEARAAGIWAEIEKSVRLYVRHMQGEAAYVRTGHHGRRISRAEAGRFEDAREIPVAVFPQHTSRSLMRKPKARRACRASARRSCSARTSRNWRRNSTQTRPRRTASRQAGCAWTRPRPRSWH